MEGGVWGKQGQAEEVEMYYSGTKLWPTPGELSSTFCPSEYLGLKLHSTFILSYRMLACP